MLAMLLVVTAVTVAGQSAEKPRKKFLTAPLTIEDQGSFAVHGSRDKPC